MTMRPIARNPLAQLLFSTMVTQMSNDRSDVDTRTPHQKKTGTAQGQATDVYSVRNALPNPAAMKKYDNYLKEHKARLRQLERIANGDMAPSSQSYT